MPEAHRKGRKVGFKRFSSKICHIGKDLLKLWKQDGDESTLGSPATEHGEKKDKEDFTTSVAKMYRAKDVM